MAANRDTVLFQLLSANFQSTADQPFTQIYSGTAFAISAIVCRQRTGAATVACVGGIYDGSNKSGNILVAATQSWLTLGAGVMVIAGLAALTANTILTAAPILSLTTGSTGACTGDLFIYGWDMT